MRIAHQAGRLTQALLRIQRNDRADVRADRVGVGGNLREPRRRPQLRIGGWRSALARIGQRHLRTTEQLQQPDVALPPDPAAQIAQVGGLERLDHHRRRARIRVRLQGGQHLVFHRQAQAAEIARVLDLRNQPNRAPGGGRLCRNEVDDLVQRHDLKMAIPLRATQLRQPLTRAQGLQLGQGEVFGEPAFQRLAIDGLARLARGKLRMAGHIGGAADLVLMARYQHAILGRHQIRLDEISAIDDSLGVGRQGMFRAQCAGTAVREDLHRLGQRRFCQCRAAHDGHHRSQD